MKKILALLTIVTVAGMLLGCAMASAPINGQLWLDVQGPVAVGTGGSAAKSGEACATSILGIIGTGDASIDAAKKAGGIREITYVDHHSTNIIGVIAKFCTVVKGN